MHVGYGGAVQRRSSACWLKPHQKTRVAGGGVTRSGDRSKGSLVVHGVNLPFITTSIKEQATDSIETFLSLARQCLAENFNDNCIPMTEAQWPEGLQDIIDMFSDAAPDERLDMLLEFALSMPELHRGVAESLVTPWNRCTSARPRSFCSRS